MRIDPIFSFRHTALIALVLFVASSVQAAPEEERPVLTFGVVPQQAASTLLRSWGPVLRFLNRETGYRFVFRTAPDIPTFEDRLAAGEYDFAYMNPYHFTVFNQGDAGYQAVARAAGKRIEGILVVRKDSAVRSLAELDGSTLAFPAPAAFAASVLPRANLEAQGIRFQPKYVSSHDSVYRAVAKGLFPAGGGVMRTFRATDPAVMEQLRVLWTTPGYTPHAIAAHPRIDSSVVDQVQQALVNLGTRTGARTMLEGLKIKGFESGRNADWDDVRALDVDIPVGSQGQGS